MAGSTKAGAAAAPDKTLEDLLEHGLGVIYLAEKKILKALERMMKAAEDEELVAALERHHLRTADHITLVARAFTAFGRRPEAASCEAIDGMLAESDRLIEQFGGSRAGDAAIIFSAQVVARYEITRYGSLRNFAEMLNLAEVAELMQRILDDEIEADERLGEIAEANVNPSAADFSVRDGEGADGDARADM